jgi:hypothetical protein
MFKSTNNFFKKVYKGNVSDIDIKNYVYVITENEHHKLITLQKDLSFFIFVIKDEIESNITPENWTEKIEYYSKKGENIPSEIHTNYISKKLNERNENKELKEEFEYYDLEKIFYPYELFCIRQLENYINNLIGLKENIYTFSEDFIKSYDKNLKRHFQEFKTSDELNYIEYEFKRYKTGIESINYIETDPKIKRTLNNKEKELFGIFTQKNLFNTFQRQNNYRINIENFKYKAKENLEFVFIAFNEILSFLGQKKLNIETPKLTKKHKDIFCNNGFELFEAFAKLHILDKYIDFSFLFQQMKFNGYILDIKHLKFMNWLLENEYINPKEHEKFLIEKSFRSLKKCAFGTRLDLYLKLKDSIIPTSSDL